MSSQKLMYISQLFFQLFNIGYCEKLHQTIVTGTDSISTMKISFTKETIVLKKSNECHKYGLSNIYKSGDIKRPTNKAS